MKWGVKEHEWFESHNANAHTIAGQLCINLLHVNIYIHRRQSAEQTAEMKSES